MRQRLKDAGLWKGKITDDIQQDIRQYGSVNKKHTGKKRTHADVEPEPEQSSDPEEGTSTVAGNINILILLYLFRKNVNTTGTSQKRNRL